MAQTARLNLAMLHKSQGQFDDALRYCHERRNLCLAAGRQSADKFRFDWAIGALYLAKVEAALREGTATAADLELAGVALDKARVELTRSDSYATFKDELAYWRGNILFRQGDMLWSQGAIDAGTKAAGEAAEAWHAALSTQELALQARILHTVVRGRS